MDNQMSRSNQINSGGSASHTPPSRTISEPAGLSSVSSAPSSTQINISDADLSSYEAASHSDTDLQTLVSALHLRTSRANNSISVGLEPRYLSVDSLSEVPESLLENYEVVKIIIQNNRDTSKNPESVDLVDDYFDNSLLTLEFCKALDACVKSAGRIESIINVALQKFEEEHQAVPEEGSVRNYFRTLAELNYFKAAESPFSQEFVTVSDSVYSKQISMLERLQSQKQKLDEKFGKLKAWKKFSYVIFLATFAAVLICSVVAAALSAPPVVTAVIAAASVPLGSVGGWLNSIWKKCEKDLRGQKEIISSMKFGNYIIIKDLGSIRVLVAMFQIEIGALLATADFAIGEVETSAETEVVVAMEDLRKTVGDFVKTIHDLSNHVTNCAQETRMARTLVLQKMINHPSRSD